ncbi:type I-B CRISPR-associated protein Cas7/Csh2 [Metallosphaera javensis (ex Sakai et al. 2022)]|uniref:type I-B CRISPR-associated protein Cas7/Csh2 n=1 Tax=Metallosphaera javensis (ex Sakai et al. 2022) TaxID=2775498 RepID=UPI0025839D7A
MKNSEILFVYEAKLTNPNGDPDDENRPRMDPKSKRNLVSDVRLKRYLRDYIASRYGEEKVWVTKMEGKTVDATDRVNKLGGPDNVLKNCIDARLFGATIPLKGEGKSKGASISYVGAVQFTWGMSLHRVDLVDSRSITSVFAGRDSGEETKYGTIGKDYRVYYSMIAFHGAVSAKRAEKLGTRDEDLRVLDNGLWEALLTETITRSKIGQRPLLYLRVEYDGDNFLGDLRRFIDVEEKDAVRDISDVKVKWDRLVAEIARANPPAVYVRCASDPVIQDLCSKLKSTLGDRVKSLPR